MAQVRKYSKGNKITKAENGEPILFTWDGYGDYNVADLESTYAQNAENYVKSLGLNDEDSKKVLDRSYAILQAMKNGQINNRNARGQWTNVPVGFESTGVNEKGREKWWKKKDYVRDDDFYNNLGYNIIDQVLKGTSTYTKPTITPKESTFKNTYQKYLTDYYFNSPTAQFDRDLWDFSAAPSNLKARLQEYRKLVEESDLSEDNKNDELRRIDEGLASFNTNDTNKIAYALARLGFDARQWLNPNYVAESSIEQPLTEAQEKQQQFTNAYNARIKDITTAGRDNYSSWKYNPMQEVPIYADLSPKELADNINWANLNAENMTNKDLLGMFHSYISSPFIRKGLEDSGYYENSWYYLPNTQDITKGLITRFNPSTYTFERVPFTSFKTGEDYLKMQLAKELGIVNPWDTTLPQGYKEGGVIKAQGGLSLDYINRAQELYNEDINNSKSKSRSNVESKPKSHIIGSEEELSDADKARIASIAADAVAGIAAFVPGYGTAVSGVAGLGSTGANAYADYKEKGLGTAAINLLPNLGLDILGMIPGGGIGAKAAKIVKSLKSAPKLFNLVGSALAANQAYGVFEKMRSGQELTLEDFQQLSSALSGLARIPGGQFVKGRAVDKGLLKEAHPLEINGQKYDLDESTYKRLLTATDKEAQENILKQAGFDIKLDDKITSFLGKNIRKIWNPTSPEYRLTEIGAKTNRLKRVGLNLNLEKPYRNYSKPEANVGNNRVISGVNKATEDFYNRTININKDKQRTAKSEQKEAAVKKKAEQKVVNAVNEATKDFYRTPTYKQPLNTEIPYSSVETPITRTVNWNDAERNYRAVQKLQADRLRNESTTRKTNAENKELNKAIDAENKTRERARKETAYNAWWQGVLADIERGYPRRGNSNLTEEQMKAKQDYVNWWMEALSNQTRQLPKKQIRISNTKKKNSGNKGYVNKHLEGGILKAQQGTTLRDVASTANWANQIYGTDAYFNWLKSFNTNNYQDFNNYQKGWNTNYLASNYNPTGINKTGNIAYSQNVWDSQGIFNKQANGVNQVIENLANTGVITRRGNSGDNAARNFQDGYFGGQEYLRHGGMESMLTPEQVAEINKNVNPQGLEYYFDPTTKMGFLRPMQQDTKSTSFDPNKPVGSITVPDEKVMLPTAEEVLSTNRTGEPGGLDINKSTGIKPQINWGDLLGTARLAGTIWTNNRIAKGLKESLSPLLLDPVQLRRQVTGDLVTRNYMENLGAEANRIGARPITSDASLQLGQQLDYNNRANEYRTKGYLADKQAIDKTTAEAQKVADFNKQQRVDVANRNRAAMLGIRQAKANIEAQRKSANWAQAVAPWLMDKEMRFRENQKLNQALDYQENQYLYGDQYEQAVKNAQNIMDSAKNSYLSANNNDDTGWLTSDAYKQAKKNYDNVVSQAAKTYRDNILKARKQSYNYNPFLFTFKSGGQLNYKEKSLLQRADAVNKSFLNDRKLFHKMITDSQKENNKLIMSLGGLTKELIIKSMTYAG